MRVGTFNANGLAGKADPILNFSQHNELDITVITETWLAPNGNIPILKNIIVNLTNANNEIIQGGRRYTGGVLIFASPAFRNSVRVVFEDPNNNYAILKIDGIFITAGYFAPSEPHQTLLDCIDKSLETAAGADLIVLGDLNARVGAVVGDHQTNQRGRALIEHIEEKMLTIIKPHIGTYSVFKHGGGGCGAPDIVLSSGLEPQNFTIHETTVLGGSDHRPITFRLENNEAQERTFSRWNVRKLGKPHIQARYRDILTDGFQEVS